MDAYLAPRDADSLLELRVAILVNRERAPTGGTISSQAVAPVTALLVTLLDPELLERLAAVNVAASATWWSRTIWRVLAELALIDL